MPIHQEYNNIFDKKILKKSNGIIFYFPLLDEDTYKYHPYRHEISDTSVENLA